MKGKNQTYLQIFSPYLCCLRIASICIWQALISPGKVFRVAPQEVLLSSASGDRCDGSFIGYIHSSGDARWPHIAG